MSILREVASSAAEENIQFLVIGGLAVVFYGYSRDTADIDLLVSGDQVGAWERILARNRYSVWRRAEMFIQFKPVVEGAWPVDLMLVREATFAPMFTASQEVEIFGARVRIPAVEHLLALKLHALRHTHIERFSKDFLDVEGIVRHSSIDLRAPKYRDLFLKYGTLDLYEKICRATNQA